MNIQKYLVDCILNGSDIVQERYDFEYADICGYSELIGWKIIFFREKKTSPFLSAICFSDIYSKEDVKFCNYILETMKSKIRFGYDVDMITKMFGKQSYIAYPYDNICRYVYLFNEKVFASFGFSKSKNLVEIEMIFDKEMANDVFESRKELLDFHNDK